MSDAEKVTLNSVDVLPIFSVRDVQRTHYDGGVAKKLLAVLQLLYPKIIVLNKNESLTDMSVAMIRLLERKLTESEFNGLKQGESFAFQWASLGEEDIEWLYDKYTKISLARAGITVII
jgi:hypothetical protein